MFRWFDYLIVLLPLIGVYSLGLYVRRYIRSVSDFVSASFHNAKEHFAAALSGDLPVIKSVFLPWE